MHKLHKVTKFNVLQDFEDLPIDYDKLGRSATIYKINVSLRRMHSQ